MQRELPNEQGCFLRSGEYPSRMQRDDCAHDPRSLHRGSRTVSGRGWQQEMPSTLGRPLSLGNPETRRLSTTREPSSLAHTHEVVPQSQLATTRGCHAMPFGVLGAGPCATCTNQLPTTWCRHRQPTSSCTRPTHNRAALSCLQLRCSSTRK